MEAELVKIALPEAIKYVLMALGSAIAAEGVEKPLTANTIKAHLPAIGIFTMLIDHWKTVGHQCALIVKAFQSAFTTNANSIATAFADIKMKASKKIR